MTVEQSYLLYYFVVIVTFFIVNISEGVRRTKYSKLSKIIFWFALLIPWIVAANRYGIGTDFFSYEKMYYDVTNYNNIIQSLINNSVEPGWIILNYLVKLLFGNNVKYIFVVSSFLILLFSFAAIYKYRNRLNISVAILIFMCTMYNPSFNVIRQILAISILLFAIKYIEDKKVFKFLFFVLLAGSFHYSALIFIPIYWLLGSNYYSLWNKVKRLTLYLFFILIVFQFESFFNFFVDIGVFSKYSIYEVNNNTSIGFGNIIVRIPIIIIILLNLKILQKRDPFMIQIIPLYFISLILFFLGYKAGYVGRIAINFEVIQILVISSIIRHQNNLSLKYLYYIIIWLYYIFFFTFNMLLGNYGETVPYLFN